MVGGGGEREKEREREREREKREERESEKRERARREREREERQTAFFLHQLSHQLTVSSSVCFFFFFALVQQQSRSMVQLDRLSLMQQPLDVIIRRLLLDPLQFQASFIDSCL